jgi:LmbE family N-acetylglucosaminyl deacetylase
MSRKILIVAAHPDDEVLGCFGTVARLIQEGYEAYTLILGEGKTSRDDTRDPSLYNDDLKQLREEIECANRLIGINKVFIEQFPDNRFDSVDLLDIVKVVTKVKEGIRPDIVFTHYKNDLNVDHQITYQAVITATRPMESESVKEIYSFEVLSSTEWMYPATFSPNVFFDITTTIDAKKRAMDCYASELRAYPHPRSIEGIELIAKNHGMKTGIPYAEAFEVVRIVR